MPDLPDSKSDGDACSSIADWARNRKRRREEIKKDTGRFLFFDFLEIKCFIFFESFGIVNQKVTILVVYWLGLLQNCE